MFSGKIDTQWCRNFYQFLIKLYSFLSRANFLDTYSPLKTKIPPLSIGGNRPLCIDAQLQSYFRTYECTANMPEAVSRFTCAAFHFYYFVNFHSFSDIHCYFIFCIIMFSFLHDALKSSNHNVLCGLICADLLYFSDYIWSVLLRFLINGVSVSVQCLFTSVNFDYLHFLVPVFGLQIETVSLNNDCWSKRNTDLPNTDYFLLRQKLVKYCTYCIRTYYEEAILFTNTLLT